MNMEICCCKCGYTKNFEDYTDYKYSSSVCILPKGFKFACGKIYCEKHWFLIFRIKLMAKIRYWYFLKNK